MKNQLDLSGGEGGNFINLTARASKTEEEAQSSPHPRNLSLDVPLVSVWLLCAYCDL
jgi:hypothetical protein